jgi:hypothetical protein
MRACRGKRPVEVREEFIDDARLGTDQQEMVAELERYEAEVALDPNFVAGQLGASVYEMTLAKDAQPYGFQGCVYELAGQLKRKLSG